MNTLKKIVVFQSVKSQIWASSLNYLDLGVEDFYIKVTYFRVKYKIHNDFYDKI